MPTNFAKTGLATMVLLTNRLQPAKGALFGAEKNNLDTWRHLGVFFLYPNEILTAEPYTQLNTELPYHKLITCSPT